MSYLRIQSLGKRYGGVVALDGVSLEIAGAGIYGLIGPNGAGKTTLFDCLAGTTAPDQGRVWLQDQDVTGWPAHRMARLGVARTFQECRILPEETCLDNVLFAAQPQGLGGNLLQMFTRGPGHRGVPRVAPGARHVRWPAVPVGRKVQPHLHGRLALPAARGLAVGPGSVQAARG